MDPLTLSLLFILGAASVDQIQEPTPLQREELIRKILTSDIAEIRAAFFDHNSSHMGTSLAFKVKVLSDHRVLDHIRALNSLTAHGREINARVARGDDRERRLNACRPVPLISEQLEFDVVDQPDFAAVLLHGRWNVTDPNGGVWYSDEDTATAINLAPDPAAMAVQICTDDPMRGEWHS